jgi:hypothetical protein
MLANYKLGEIYFAGQAAGNIGASIAAYAESDWNTAGDPTDNPGYLTFSTTADGASTPTERLRITSAGLVGIGTSSPGESIHTTGKLRVGDGGNYTVAAIQLGASNANGISYPGTNILNFITSSTAALTIDASQRVGIGTTSPADTSNFGRALDINGTTGAACYVRTNGSATNYGLIGHYGTDFYVNNNSNGPIRFFANGDERARIDSSGKLLVGTSSTFDQSARLQVIADTGTSVAANFYSYGADNSQFVIGAARGTVASPTTLNSSDTIGGVYFRGHPSSDLPSRLVFSTTADGASSPTERMRITNGGDFYFNCTVTTKTTEGFRVENDGQPSVSRGSAGSFMLFFHAGDGSTIGSITNSGGTATAYNTSSDYRLKENVNPVSDGITRLQQLKPSRFNFISDPDTVIDGFLAHEVQAVVPECVTGEKDAVDDDGNPVYQGIDQSKLVPLLTAALQEAIAKIETLEARLTAAGIE